MVKDQAGESFRLVVRPKFGEEVSHRSIPKDRREVAGISIPTPNLFFIDTHSIGQMGDI